MTVELTMLVYAVILLIALIVIQTVAGLRAQGFKALAGSRDNLPEPTAMQARTKRVVDNHREGLTAFAPLILVAATAHISNELTILGAQLFFYSRMAHAVIYLAGWPYIRPFVYAIGATGMALVAAALLGVGR